MNGDITSEDLHLAAGRPDDAGPLNDIDVTEGSMAKYGKKAHEKVEKAVSEHKHEGKYKSRKQAVAAGLNQAREEGAKVPKKKGSKK